jgi:hypothetical protein
MELIYGQSVRSLLLGCVWIRTILIMLGVLHCHLVELLEEPCSINKHTK